MCLFYIATNLADSIESVLEKEQQDISKDVEPPFPSTTFAVPSRYFSNYVELREVNVHEFQLFLRLLYSGYVEIIGDSVYSRILHLLHTYDVEYKGRKLRDKDSLRILRASGAVEGRTSRSDKLKSVYVVQLPYVGFSYRVSKKNPMPYADIVFKISPDPLRMSRNSSAGQIDPAEILADKMYLANLRLRDRTNVQSEKKNVISYAGHKAILCARCKYFNSLTLQDSYTVHFDDNMDKEVFRIFLNFIYDEPGACAPKRLQDQIDRAIQRRREKKAKRSADNQQNEEMAILLTLLTVSGKYGLDDLKIQCEHLLLNKLDPNNVFKVFQCACSSGANQLKQVQFYELGLSHDLGLY